MPAIRRGAALASGGDVSTGDGLAYEAAGSRMTTLTPALSQREREQSMPDHPYDLIVGLETHVQLLTESKLFCGCSTKFGAPPNTQTCPVCIGMPGSLPVMNKRAFELSLQAALALNCEIPEFTKWDRKQY